MAKRRVELLREQPSSSVGSRLSGAFQGELLHQAVGPALRTLWEKDRRAPITASSRQSWENGGGEGEEPALPEL
ncbi:Hypothetical predicted protein, partial [Marmota monax]